MHWIMWVFWGFFAALFLGGWLVDRLTGGKYNFNKKENTSNQNQAQADALRQAGRNNNDSGSF